MLEGVPCTEKELPIVCELNKQITNSTKNNNNLYNNFCFILFLTLFDLQSYEFFFSKLKYKHSFFTFVLQKRKKSVVLTSFLYTYLL